MNSTYEQAEQGAASEHDSSYFLGLPGEIGNRIYRYALLDNSARQSTDKGLPEPGLLLVSKLARAEAIEIYYT